MPTLKDVPAGACVEERSYCSDYEPGKTEKCKHRQQCIPESKLKQSAINALIKQKGRTLGNPKKLSYKYQIVVPPGARDLLEVSQGEELQFYEYQGSICLLKVKKESSK
jgi:hypothetical protein